VRIGSLESIFGAEVGNNLIDGHVAILLVE